MYEGVPTARTKTIDRATIAPKRYPGLAATVLPPPLLAADPSTGRSRATASWEHHRHWRNQNDEGRARWARRTAPMKLAMAATMALVQQE